MDKKQAFFDLGTGIDPNKTGKTKVAARKIGCSACGLYHDCEHAKIEPRGQGKKKILFIAEYPGEYEDEKGTVLSREARSLLTKTLADIDISLKEDCWLVHAVRCVPEDGAPTDNEISYCRTKLLQTIEELNPEVIIPMGQIALKGLIHHRISGRLSGTKMESFFGEFIPDQEIEKWICPTYSAEFIINERLKEGRSWIINPLYLRLWKKSITKACKKIGQFTIHHLESDILTTVSVEEAKKWLKDMMKDPKIVTFDYEATGIKPHAEGHSLTTCSWSDGLLGYACPYFSEDEEFCKLWYKFTRSKKVKKVAHNLSYENSWTKYQATGKYVRGWAWDTCLAAHCINSFKPTGQKFWTYTLLGILNYDDSVDQYLKASDTDVSTYGGNAINSISKADLTKLLLYNGQDSLFCYHIMEWQKSQLKAQYLEGYKMFQKGSEVLSQVQNEGMLVNMERLYKNEKYLTKKINRLHDQLYAMPEVAKWDKREPINITSDQQLKHLLYDIIKTKPPRKGNKWTDEKQLTAIDTEFTKTLIPYKKLLKMRDTYLAQFKREQVNGVIRPSFNLNIPKTLRSSSNGPNFQNMPAHDPIAMKYVMSNIVPRLGNKLIEWDYKGVEVACGCCVHKDPQMIKYVSNPKNDMHGDTAADILLMDRDKIPKEERYMAKGDFVFPSFYGMGPARSAPALWDHMATASKTHLYNAGIRTYKDFLRHIEEVYRIFWEERFPVYAEWKNKCWKDYLKKGYVELKSGFRYYGPAKFTQVTNAPIQGPAFHILLWTLTQIYPIIKKEFDRSFIIGQIHDAMVGDIHPEDEGAIDALVKEYGTVKVREHWDWIILPFRLEKDATAINQSWNTMSGRGFI